jgi:hypothetical protein
MSIDPYRRERQLLWQNRVAEWRAEPGEAAFHCGALALLAAFASVLLWQGWPRLLTTIAWLAGEWPLATALIALIALAELQAAALRRQRAQWARHWLIAQPIAEALRRRRLRMQVARRAALQIAIGSALLLAAGLPAVAALTWVVLVIAAALLGWRGAQRAAPAKSAAPRRESVLAPRAQGSFFAWQWTEAAAALVPYRLSRLVWLVLLVPRGSWTQITAVLMLVGAGIAVVMWSRSVAVLPAAQRWLAAQPLRGRDLIRRTARFPGLLATMLAILVTLPPMSIGRPAWAMVAAASVLMPASLHFAVTAAERRRPGRIGLTFALHLMVLAAALQALPLLVPALWLAQCVWLLRKEST